MYEFSWPTSPHFSTSGRTSVRTWAAKESVSAFPSDGKMCPKSLVNMPNVHTTWSFHKQEIANSYMIISK